MIAVVPKEIWLPKSETKATVRDGAVVPWQEMSFAPKPVNAAPAGFGGVQPTKEPT
jgi:hypothetical protein